MPTTPQQSPIGSGFGATSTASAGVMPYAIDPDAAERLWTYSVELTGVDGPR